MLNIRKRFFLLLTIVGLLFGIAACTNNDDYVRLSFDNDVYEVKVGQTIDVSPIVNKGSNVGAVTIEYTSYDDQIASYSNGKLQGLRVGETVIKVVCSEKPIAYDIATVRVVANSLPEVEFEPLQQNMLKGTTQTLKYHFVPEYSNALMSFISANPEIATVDENGVITGVAKGVAIIIARATDELDENQYRDYAFVVEVLEADFAIQYELNGGTNDPSNPAGYNVLNLPIVLKNATKLGHNFVGWYDNPEFNGNPITEIAANSTGDITLYAKWEVSVFDITYELNGGTNASENPDQYDVNKLPLLLEEPTKTGYNFLGWYLGDEKVDSIADGTIGEVKLVAKWEIATYNITFDLVGGLWQDLTGIEWPYNRDRNKMVADFIVDFNKHSGKTVAADGSDFFARSWMADGSSAGYKFLISTEYGSKWGWLLDFINDNRLANGKTVLNENDNQAEARGELHNFLNACAPGDKGGNASYGCDYSTEEGTNGFWLYMVDLEEVLVPKTYTIESEDILLPEIAYKMGYKFLGWFLNGERVEKIVKGTTGDLNFVAEWEIVEYTIEYNLNGGLFDIYLYSSREEMVDDFLTDAMTYYGKDKKPNCMVDNSGTNVGFTNVFTAIYGIFSSEEYGTKWAWLKEYIINTATDAKASLESGNEAYWRYSLGAFLFEDHRTSWPASADYTNDELANGFWSLLLKEGAVGPQNTYTVNDEVILLTPTKEGCVFLGWFLNGEKIEKISKGTIGNLVLEAKWYNPNAELDIDYQLDGGVLPEDAPTKFVAKDGLVTLPTPIKVGYMFKGWYEDIECTKEVTNIASGRSEGVVLYALWELETYKIEYETNGGEFLTDSVAPLYATFDELVSEFINDYSNFTGISGITAESFYGKSNQYGLYGFFKNEEMATKWNWLLNFVIEMATEVGYSGKVYLMLSAGAANFNKYSRSNFAAFLQQTHLTKISPISMNFENVDSEALWAACPTKDIQIGIEAKYDYTVLDLPLELATPNKEGATFIGWYTNSDLKNGKIDKLTIETIGNIKLYARWSDSTINFDTFNINYELDGGVLEEGAPTSYVEETGVALKGATKPGYTFKGWYLDVECTKVVTEITAQDKGDITLYACWEAVTYTITYEVGEGTLPVETVRVSGYDSLEQIVEDLLKDYSSYTGNTYTTPADLGTSAWPSDADRNFGTFYLSNVNGVNMYEKYSWLLEYLLEVNTSGEYPRILVKYKNPATCVEVADETYAFYYAFKGFVQAMQYRSGNSYWETANYADATVLNKALDFAPDAVYEEKPVSAEFTLETLPFELPIPTAPEGKKFVGWYQNSEFSGDVWFEVPVGTIGDLTLYAKYVDLNEKVKYSIVYVLGDGTLSGDIQTEYTAGEVLTLTANAIREGYIFKGWYLDATCTQLVTEISADTLGNITLYACWEAIEYSVEFVNVDGLGTQTMAFDDLLPVPTKEGYTFKGWYRNPDFSGDVVTTVVGEGKYYAKWEENATYYNIEYVLDGATLPEGNWNQYNKLTGLVLPIAHKEGARFIGWTLDEKGLQFIEEIVAGSEGDYKLYAIFEENKSMLVVGADAQFKTLAEALTAANEGDTIKLLPGEYDEDVTIDKANLTIIGSNASLNPNVDTRGEEALLKGVISVSTTATNLTINGLAFTGKAKIKNNSDGNYQGFNFLNNLVYDTEVDSSNWGETGRYLISAFIEFKMSSGGTTNNFYFANNRFENVSTTNILVNRVKNLIVDNCVFLDFDHDAIRLEGGYNYGDLYFTGNLFEQTVVNNGNNAIFLQAVAGASGTTTKVLVANNTFKQIGNSSVSLPYNGAISAHTFQEAKTDWEITGNIFDHCYNYLYLRNNGASASNWSCKVENNQFLGLPATHYFGTYNGSDTETTNPHLAEFGANYYEDNDGEVITDLSVYSDLFKHLKTYGTTLSDDLIIRKNSVIYVLNGGKLEGSAIVDYDAADNDYSLAVPTKDGYKFLGWTTINGVKLTKLDKGTTGIVTVYANWYQLPVYSTINYVLNGGTLSKDAPVEYKEGIGTKLLNPTLNESFFVGWYLSDDFSGNPVTEITPDMTGDITLYARFAAYVYKNIEYVLDGGILPDNAPTNYVVTVGVDLSNIVPTKDGHKFLGWFDNAEGLGNPITEISKDEEEDITLYALWQDESVNFDVTYVLNGGNTKWDSRDALITEFLSDFSAIAGKTITAANFTTAARETEFNALIKDDAMWAKWKWLFEFIASTDKHEKAPDFYNKVLNDRDGSDPDNKWFLTRDFAGFVNKTIGNFWFSVSPVDYSLFVNADGFWSLIETEYKAVDTNTLLTPYRPYYIFEGWYDNPELIGNPVKVIESDCTLYAKWSKQTVTLTYVMGDVDATMDQTEVLVHVSDSFDLATPTYDDRYLKFNGWYLEPECINPVTKVNEYTNSDMTVYASWTEIDGYTINYVLNGGSLIYEDRDALLADFLKDYNEAMGKSYLTVADIPTGNFADINYHTFFTKVLSDGTNIREKWLWLAEYLLELSRRDLPSNNCNILGLDALINNKPYTGDAIYGLSYAFRAFLIGTTIRPGSSYSSVDYTIYENAHGFWDKLSAAENTEYLNNKGTVILPTAYLENYKFVGWYTNPEFTGEPVTSVEDTITLYAKFVEATPVESVSIDNKITELKRYETYQLEWSINPSNANIQAVKFESSDTSVATVDNKGLITAISNGTVTIKMTSLSPSGKTDEFTFEVYSPDHFDINYETNSYVEIGKSILLLADYVKRDGSKVNLVWSSLTPEIASVDAGAVTGLKAGQAVIRVALADDESTYQDFIVTVLDSNLSDALKYILSAHESNAFLSYDLGIGAGTPAYYRDIVGSVSKLLYNEPLTIDDRYYATANANDKNHGGKMSSIEFITVHYTGNMGKGSTASANANYFANDTSTSIHYVTGNDGVFSVLDDSYVAYHAGDGTSVKFEWFPTGVTYKDGDPVYPVFGITANSKFSINGVETTISVPEGTTAATKKVTDSKWINDMGLAFKIVDGQYYMGTTWWCYSQVAEGRICSKGGNLNSIGIESAVNPESNLWYTWQRTAQLVARLMLENDLDITRVKGHHFYSAKDCPQPLLENDLEIWWKFIEMVEHEYDMLTKFKDYQFTFELNTETTTVNNNGRVVEQPLYTEVVTYTITVNNGTTSETITLSTIVEGMYCK